MSQTTERRVQDRVPFALEVDLVSEHNFYSGLTGNISEGGLFIGTHVLPAIGEQLEVDLKLPGMKGSVRVRGVVRWLRDLRCSNDDVSPGFGLEWNAPPSELLNAVRDFVATTRDSLYYEAA
jgi:uncharacterized protein (TIGR02266 family)